MNNRKNVISVTAVCCIAAGLLILLGTLCLIRFDFSKLNTVHYEMKTRIVEETVENIDIQVAEADIRLVPADDGICKVVYCEDEKIRHTIEVTNDRTLTVTRQDTRRWYEHLSVNFFWGADETAAVTVYLPLETYKKATLTTVSGEIEVPATLRFTEAKLQSTSGDISFTAKTREGLRVKSVSGSVHLENAEGGDTEIITTSGDVELKAIAGNQLYIKTTSGETELTDIRAEELKMQTTSGDISVTDTAADLLEIKTTSGDVELDTAEIKKTAKLEAVSGEIELYRFDASSISVQTVSGDVTGLLSTGKSFSINTVSGSVHVPFDTPDGGSCSVKTTSGDINIDVLP